MAFFFVLAVHQNHREKCKSRVESTHQSPSQGMKDAHSDVSYGLDSNFKNTLTFSTNFHMPLSASVVPIHV